MATLATVAQRSERPILQHIWTHADGTTGERLGGATLSATSRTWQPAYTPHRGHVRHCRRLLRMASLPGSLTRQTLRTRACIRCSFKRCSGRSRPRAHDCLRMGNSREHRPGRSIGVCNMATLTTVAQGSERPTVVLTWTHADNTTGEDLTDAATHRLRQGPGDGEVRAISAQSKSPTQRTACIEWTPDPFDVAEYGAYQVQFQRRVAGGADARVDGGVRLGNCRVNHPHR